MARSKRKVDGEKKKEDRKSDKKCYPLMKKKKRTNFLYRFVIEEKKIIIYH